MSVRLNVGCCRKVGEANYGSRGASANLEVEIDDALAADAGQLRQRLRQLFVQVREAVTEELKNGPAVTNASIPNQQPPSPKSLPMNGTPNHVRSGVVKPATPAQIKAIYAIGRQQQIDLGSWLQERCQVRRPDELTLGQASFVIDELKKSDAAK